jgi:hypothetical protein
MITFFEGQQCVEYGAGKRQNNEGDRYTPIPVTLYWGTGRLNVALYGVSRW